MSIPDYKTLVVSALLSASMGAPAFAATYDFTYNVNDEDYLVYGFKKKETYDIAIKIDDPSLVGCRVIGMYVNVPSEPEWVENVSAWMSKELTLESKVNVPDIASKPTEVKDLMLDVTFDEPYTITEEGVYVGYSFTVTELHDFSNQPIACVYGNTPGGLFVHTSRSRLKWSDLVSSLGAVSTMVVRLDTDFGPSDAALAVPEVSYAARGEESHVKVVVSNHGENPIQSLSYAYSAGDFSGKGSVSLDSPIPPCRKGNVDISIDAIAQVGSYPFSVTLESVNGEVNGDAHRSAAGMLDVLPFMPVNRPLVEEFTGLNCGYCPRGFVAMEQMNHDYPDLFVGMAYHGGSYERGCMVTTSPSDWPVDVPGFPNGVINREQMMDPSYFTSRWESFRANVPVADVNVDLEWADEAKTKLKASADVRFVYDSNDAGYRLSLALVASGLTNPAWSQSNYYSGDTPDSNPDSPYWEPFLNGGSKVSGLVFNDVVAYYKDIQGIEGSIPSDIKAGEVIPYSYSIDMADVKNEKGEDFINDGATLHMVAVVLDADGRVVNSNKSASVAVGDNSYVGEVSGDGLVVETVYYDMQGRRVADPGNGVFVKIERMSDGISRHSKVIVK